MQVHWVDIEEDAAGGEAGRRRIVLPRGELLETGAQFEAVIMQRDIEPRRGATPYAASGNRPIVILCLLVVAGFWLRTRAS